MDAASPSPQPPAHRARRALCLCGGGATGAAYQVGVLAALEAMIPGFRTGDFELIVGTSAGSLVGALLAAGVPVTRLYTSILDGDDFFAIQRRDVYQLDLRETAWKLMRIGRVGARLGRQWLQDPTGDWRGPALGDLSAALPDGLFSMNGYVQFIDRFLARHGLARTFDQLPGRLMVPVNNLDTGHRDVFGLGYRTDASVPEAIAASSAIPLFFSPVRVRGRDYIDGGSGRVAHVDLAQQAGMSHVLVINPIVPWNLERRLMERRGDDADIAGATLNRIRSRGMVAIWNQSFRMSNAVKLHLGLRRLRADRPDMALALIEPDEKDDTLFVTNPMNMDARARIARVAYETTVARLQSGDDAVRAVCLGLPEARHLDGLHRRDDRTPAAPSRGVPTPLSAAPRAARRA